MEITLPVIGQKTYVDVKATLLFNLAPHLSNVATFALHKCMPDDPDYRGRWFVSNVETGRWVAYHSVKAQALRNAADILADKTENDLLASYRKFPECT